MNTRQLPTSVEIDGVECEFYSDYRDIIDVMNILDDPDLLEGERIEVALDNFYKTDDYKNNIHDAIIYMYQFISQSDKIENKNGPEPKPLYDWDKDFNIIVAPVNKIIGKDVRGIEYLHWWTFLSAFMEIGECTFSTYVSIRDKLNRGKKLEKYEERIYRENKDDITLKKKVDSTTQAILDEIMGV